MNVTTANGTSVANASFITCYDPSTVVNLSLAAQRFYLALTVLCGFGILVTCSSNLLFIVAMLIHRRRITIGQKMLIVLAVIDLTQGLTMWPMQVYFQNDRRLGVLNCDLLYTQRNLGFVMAWSTLIAICLIVAEQYLAIGFPFTHERVVTFTKLLVALLVPSIVNVIACIVLNAWLKVPRYWVIYRLCIGAVLVMLLGTITVFQVHVTYIANRARRQITQQNSVEGRTIRERAKAVKAAMSIILAFLTCYIPFAVYTVYVMLSKDNSLSTRTFAKPITELFGLSTTMVDPVVYYWRSAFVRRAIKQVLCRKGARVGVAGHS